MTNPVSDVQKMEHLTDSQQGLEERERQLKEHLERLRELERRLESKEAELQEKELQIRDKEKSMKEKEKAKKQILLRLSPALWEDLAAWAEDDFRSINSQIEYLLTECVKQRKKNGGYVSEELDKPLELDFLKDE